MKTPPNTATPWPAARPAPQGDADEPTRRLWLQRTLGGCALGLGAPWAIVQGSAAWAAPVPARAESPRVGVDPIFVRTGLTDRWRTAMGRDLGWQAQWQEMDSATVLKQLEAGEIDAGLFLSGPQADDLDRQGLIYNRQTIATTPVWLLGPNDDQAGIRGEREPGRAISQVMLAAQAGAATWVAPPPQSPLAGLVQQLLPGPLPRLDRQANAKPPAGAAYELVPRVLQRPGDRRKIWLQDDRLVLQAQVACSFRSRHPGSKLLVTWLGWPVAQSAFRQVAPGWQGQPSTPQAGRKP